jgi:hypothetical protein
MRQCDNATTEPANSHHHTVIRDSIFVSLTRRRRVRRRRLVFSHSRRGQTDGYCSTRWTKLGDKRQSCSKNARESPPAAAA